jgi:uncharacterized glyoxalase superfamily protein PhnB
MTKPVPDGYHTLTPYLTVPDGEGMLRFLQNVFGAKVHFRQNRPDGSLQHSELLIGDSKIIYVYLPDVDTVYKRALDAGAKSLQPVATQFYGDRSGGVEDAAGNWWWIATHVEDVSEEEINRRAQAQQLQAK